MTILLRTALAAAAVATAAPALAAAPCDRACQEQTLEAYLRAVTARDVAKAPLATGYRQTENGLEVKPGDGVWKTATALGAVQRRYFDPVSGQAAYFGLVQEGDQAAVSGLRVKFDGPKVAEAEWILGRKGAALWSPPGLERDPPRPDTAIPAAQRASRANLRAAADSYFEGLQTHKGATVKHKPGCVRVENGTRVTGERPQAPAGGGANANLAVEFDSGDCASNFERMTQIHAVVDRRYPVLDEEAGVAIGFGLFRRPPGGALRRDGTPWPRLRLMEVFATEKGQIVSIHAAMSYLPPDAPESSGWPVGGTSSAD